MDTEKRIKCIRPSITLCFVDYTYKRETAKGSVKAKEGQGHKVELEWEEDGKTLSMCFLASVENFLASFDSFIASVEKS